MILDYLYYGNAIQLSQNEMKDYLETAFILENNYPVKQQICALERMEEMNALQTVSFLPLLTDSLLLKSRRQFRREQTDQDSVYYFQEKCKEIIKSLFELSSERNTEDTEISRDDVKLRQCPLFGIIQKLETVKLDEIPNMVSEYIEKHEIPETDVRDSFLEADFYAPEILLLSLLGTAKKEKPEALQDIDLAKLLDTALDKKCGLFPWQLAVDLYTDMADTFKELISSFPRYWKAIPCCIRAAVRYRIEKERNPKYIEEDEEVSAAIMSESWQWNIYQDVGMYKMQSVWLEEGGSDEELQLMSAIIWQLVCWDTAYDYDPDFCAGKVANYWNTPSCSYHGSWNKELSENNLINDLQKRVVKGSCTSAFNEKVIANAVASPWLHCEDSAEYSHGAGAFEEFPLFIKPYIALRSFFAAVWLRKVLREGNGIQQEKSQLINNYRVLINMGDAYDCEGARLERGDGNLGKIWSVSLRGLACFAYDCVQILGKGQENPNLPLEIIENIARDRKFTNKELATLQSGRSLLVGARWAAESLSMIANPDDIEKCAWFRRDARDGVSGAERVCYRLLERHYEKAVRSRYVHELLDQLYDRLIYEQNETQEGHWMDRFMEDSEDFGLGDGRIELGEIVLHSALALEDWKQLTHLNAQDFTPAAWLVIQTRRLACFIAHYTKELAEDVNAQVKVWSYTLSTFSPEEIRQNPVVLFELCQLLRPEGGKANLSLEQMSEIAPVVIDTVFDYIDGDHLYYAGILAQHLSVEQVCYPYSYRTMMDAQKNFIMHLYEMEAKDGRCTQLLNRYLLMIQKILEQQSAASLRKEIESEFLARTTQKRSGRLTKIKAEEWNSLTDRFFQRRGDDLTVVRPPQSITKDSWNNQVDNAFSGSGGQPAEDRTSRLGIVFSRKDITTEEDKRNRQIAFLYEVKLSDKFINVNYRAADKKRYGCFEVGDIVAVSDDKKGGYVLYNLAWQICGESEVLLINSPLYQVRRYRGNLGFFQFRLPNGQVIRYPNELDIKELNISETVKEPDNQKNYSKLLDYWVPDIIDSYRDDFRFTGYCYEAVFDKKIGGYIPVERNFTRLLLEQIFVTGNEEHRLKIIYIESRTIRNQSYDLFSAAPGINYLLPKQIWLGESMEEALGENSLEFGMRINCELAVIEGIPYLRPCMEQPVEYDNLALRDSISEGDSCYLDYNKETKSLEYSFEINGRKYTINGHVVDKLIHRSCNVTVAENGWTLMNQRRRMLDCVSMNEYSMNEAFCNANKIREIMNLKTGDLVHMDRLIQRNSRNGNCTGMLECGMPVYCAVETVSMCAPFPDSLCMNRDCVVENIYEYPVNESSDYIPYQIPELDGFEEAEGIVGKFINHQENENVWLDLWLLNEGEVIVVKVPSVSFTVSPKNQGAAVKGYKTADGSWIFYSRNRRINVRALWKIKDHTADADAEIYGRVLAQNIKIAGKSGYGTVSQDLQEPIMHIWNSRITVPEAANCGITGHDGMVNRVNPHFCDGNIFRYIKRQDTVCLKQNNMLVWGESAQNEFVRSQRAWSAELLMGVPSTLSGLSLFDIHRVFHREAAASGPAADFTKQDADIYREWLAREDNHIFGILDRDSVLLRDMKIPEQVSAYAAYDKFTNRVRLFPGEELTWVSVNPKYPYSSNVRAILKERDNQWYASCKNAVSYQVDNNLAAEFHAVDEQIITQPIYYAGYDENQNFRFEWGYGYHFIVNPEDLIDENGNQIGSNLFFGDCIREFRLIKGNGSYNWQMCINESAVEHQIAYQIWRDAVENNVLQLLKIHIDRFKREIDITDVTLVDYNLNISRGMNGWNYHNYYRRGNLNNCSVHQLLAEDGAVTEERVILAELDPRSVANRHASLIFNYISLDEADEKPEKLKGKTVCMVGRNIQATGNTSDRYSLVPTNDYRIRFELPGGTDFNATVLRRWFSLDESKLRICAMEDQTDKYNGKNMLVTITDKFNCAHSWKGSVIGNICRSIEGLKQWIRKDKSCLVVLDDPQDGKVRAEIAPGIICRLDVDMFTQMSNRQLQAGDLASVSLDEEGKITGQIVFPSDRNYIPETGRVVELLPIDSTIRNYLANRRNMSGDDWDESKDQLKGDSSRFSVAGFPQILISNRRELEKAMMEPLPRLRYICRKNNRIEIVNNAAFTAANLSIDFNTNQPRLIYFHPEKKEEETEWSRISYMDASPYAIRRFAERGKWYYHDKETTVFNSLKNRFEKRSLPRGRYKNLIVFPDTEGRLRMKPSDMICHAYSAREIAENGLPDKNQFYPVAAATDSSIWIELMPGRIIELPKNYLFVGNEHISLENVYTHCFAAGDLLKLDEAESFVGGQKIFLIKEFRPGMRGVLGSRNSYIPTLDISRDKGMLLGFDKLHMTYPAANIGEWYGIPVVCLTADNRILPVQAQADLKCGDTVFLCQDEQGNITACGNISNAVFRPAYKGKWRNAEWLHDIMSANYYAGRFLEDINLPVVITDVKNERDTIIFYAFAQDNLDASPENTILCGVCVGVFPERLQNGEKEWKVLVRSGHNLIRIKYKNFLRGISSYYMRDVVKELALEGKGLWFHKGADGEWHSGICDSSDEYSPKAELIRPIESAKGYLCQSNLTMCMYWLPGSQAARVEWTNILQIWSVLSRRPVRNTRRLANGTISLIDTTASIQKYNGLHFNHAKFRAIPYLEIRNATAADDHKLVYLAELYPLGDLVCLESELPLIDEANPVYEPILVELIRKRVNHVLVTPYGTTRTAQHLPPWMNNALASVLYHGHYNVLRFRNNSSKNLVPVRYAKYKEDYWRGNSDAERNSLNLSYLNQKADGRKMILNEWVLLKTKLCYLSAFLDGRKTTDAERQLAYQYAVILVRDWLDKDGRVLISSLQDNEEPQHKKHMDLLPLLCAIRLVDSIGRIDIEKYDLKKIGLDTRQLSAAKELAVHLTRIVGLMCDSSIHVEVIIRKWIYADKLSAAWNCLDNISLGGMTQNGKYDSKFAGDLLPKQVDSIRTTCRHIQKLSGSRSLEDLKLVGDSLLYSIGELENYNLFMKKLKLSSNYYYTVRLALLGHLLTPANNGKTAALWQLNSNMRCTLKSIEIDQAKNDWPLAVMMNYVLPLCDDEKKTIFRIAASFKNKD